MKWAMWQNVGVDRIGCAWLIRKFIDPKAKFLFIPQGTTAVPEGAEPFDIPGVPKFGGNFPVATKQRQNQAIALQLNTKIIFPNSSTEIPVSHVLLSYWMQDARFVVPQSPPSTQYEYKNKCPKFY